MPWPIKRLLTVAMLALAVLVSLPVDQSEAGPLLRGLRFTGRVVSWPVRKVRNAGCNESSAPRVSNRRDVGPVVYFECEGGVCPVH